MTISPSDDCGGHDTARRAKRKLVWIVAGLGLVAALLVLVFLGYRQPELLLDYVNLRYCG